MWQRLRRLLGWRHARRTAVFASLAVRARPAVQVVSGPHVEDAPLAGLTVAEVRVRVAERLDVAPRALAYVNGRVARGDDRLIAGDVLEFVRYYGEMHESSSRKAPRRRARSRHLRAV